MPKEGSIESRFQDVLEETRPGDPLDIERLAEKAEYEVTIADLRARVAALEEEKMALERGAGATGNLEDYIRSLQEQNLALKRDLEEKTHLAETDSRTGLPNKDGFERKVRPLHALFAGQPAPLIENRNEPKASLNLLVIDFDRFKDINDRYGHLAGDAALKHMADILRATVRQNDVVARWGGDEFAVSFMGLDNGNKKISEDRGIVAEKLRRAIENQPLEYRGKTIPLTASFGAAKARSGESFEEFFVRADYAAKLAKERGRNTVVISEIEEEEQVAAQAAEAAARAAREEAAKTIPPTPRE